MAGFENFRLEGNWQYIDFDPFYTVIYGKCFTVLLPQSRFCMCMFFFIRDHPDSILGTLYSGFVCAYKKHRVPFAQFYT